jgi:hypothetical protein
VDKELAASLGLRDSRRTHRDVYLPKSAIMDVVVPIIAFPLPARHRRGVPLPVGALVVGTIVPAPPPYTGFRMASAAPCTLATLAFVAFARHGTTHGPLRLNRLLCDAVNRDKMWVLIRAFESSTADLSFLTTRDAWAWPGPDPALNAAEFVLDLSTAMCRNRIAQAYFELRACSGSRALHAFREKPRAVKA